MWPILNISSHLTAKNITVHSIPSRCYTYLELHYIILHKSHHFFQLKSNSNTWSNLIGYLSSPNICKIFMISFIPSYCLPQSNHICLCQLLKLLAHQDYVTTQWNFDQICKASLAFNQSFYYLLEMCCNGTLDQKHKHLKRKHFQLNPSSALSTWHLAGSDIISHLMLKSQ